MNENNDVNQMYKIIMTSLKKYDDVIDGGDYDIYQIDIVFDDDEDEGSDDDDVEGSTENSISGRSVER